MIDSMHSYEVHPRKDRRGVDLVSDALPFGRLWYGEPNAVPNAIYCLEKWAGHRRCCRQPSRCFFYRTCDLIMSRRLLRIRAFIWAEAWNRFHHSASARLKYFVRRRSEGW